MKNNELASLATRALLMDVDFSWFYTEKEDRKISDDVAKRNKVKGRAGRYLKNLYPFTMPEYDAAKLKYWFIKRYYHAYTRPWEYGKRLLKASFFPTMNDFMKAQSEGLHELDRNLARALPNYQKMAEEHMNGMYRASDYPTAQDLAQPLFAVTSVTYDPLVAPGDFRVELDKGLLEELRKAHMREFKLTQEDSDKKLWERVLKSLMRIAKLSAKEAKVFDSAFEEIDELAEALPALNMMDDPRLDEFAKQIKETLANRSVHIVRTDLAERADVAVTAQRLADKMKRLMG